jgi:bifunctional DNA-binding transcriptional regulator/antitoxin component of YhaV-PrlF toxin-antitoxin module
MNCGTGEVFAGQDCLTMQIKVSTKGQVVLRGPLRRRLGISTVDASEANIEAADRSQVFPRGRRAASR